MNILRDYNRIDIENLDVFVVWGEILGGLNVRPVSRGRTETVAKAVALTPCPAP